MRPEPQQGLHYVCESISQQMEGTGNIPTVAFPAPTPPPLLSALLTFYKSLADTEAVFVCLVLSNPNTNLCCFKQTWELGWVEVFELST